MRSAILAATFWAITGNGDGRVARPPESDGPVQPKGRLWITGASNIRPFTCHARTFSGTVKLRANATRRPLLSGENVSNAVSISVRVAELDCGNWKINHDLRKVLRASAHERIEFHLDSYDVQVNAPTPTARIAGRLRITGTERPVVVAATVECDTLGSMHVRGTHVVRMTAFGVEPPRRFGGLLRVRDSLAIHFDIVPSPIAGAADVIPRTAGEPAVSHYAGGRYAAEF